METKYMRMSAGRDYQVKADQLVNIVQDIAETAIQYGMSIETDKEAEDIAEKNLDEAMSAFLNYTLFLKVIMLERMNCNGKTN